MAIYHLNVTAISRSAGRSATAAAAYRAGVEIVDNRTGEVHDYTRKRGVVSADLVLPEGAPGWAADRVALWNAAEAAEKRKDSCVAREYEVALPSELSESARRDLALAFARELAGQNGCAVDVSIHAPDRHGDKRNHHAHILTTTRKLGADGLGEKCDIERAGRGRRADLENVRRRWADLCNDRMQAHGIDARVDHRSLDEQKIARIPTIHLGPAATAFERRTGEPSRRRLAYEDEVQRRLALARELGELERESKSLGVSIIDTETDLSSLLAQQAKEKEQEAKRARALALAQQDPYWQLKERGVRVSKGPINTDSGRYSGKIVAVTETHVAMDWGGSEGVVAHDRRRVPGQFSEGQQATIQYVNGRGADIARKPDLDRTIQRGR